MYTRCFQIVDQVKSAALGTLIADIYNTEEEIKSAGYCKSGFYDQYGYDLWRYNALEARPYYKQEYALLLPIR